MVYSVQFMAPSLRELVVIRPLCCDDVEKMVGFFGSLGGRSKHFFHPHDFDRNNAERICRDTDSGSYRIVAECCGRIVGYAWYSPLKESGYATVGIGISDDFQGKRLGGALMDALSTKAASDGLSGLKLTVYKDNERGVRLYTSRGYRIVGVEGPQHVMVLELKDTRSEGGCSNGS